MTKAYGNSERRVTGVVHADTDESPKRSQVHL